MIKFEREILFSEKGRQRFPVMSSPAVEDGPRDLAGVPLQEVCLVAPAVDELESLKWMHVIISFLITSTLIAAFIMF